MAPSQAAPRMRSDPENAAHSPCPELESELGIFITVQATPGQTIAVEGDLCQHCFRVLTGAVRLYKATVDGRRQVLRFLFAGDTFGLVGAHYSHSVEAITHTALGRARRATLAAVIRQRPALADRVLKSIAAELEHGQEHMLLLGRKNAREKVASMLLELARLVGDDEARPAFQLPISRQDMADYLGLTIETVSRTMTRLEKEGLVALPTPRDVILLQPKVLVMVAEGAT